MVAGQIDDEAGAQFVTTARQLLGAVGWQSPMAGQAGVVLFDSASWVRHAADASALIEPAERERAARCRFERERVAYVTAHALWRVVLADALQVGTGEVALGATPSGQPTLRGTGVATSLSHSGSWVAIAVGRMVTLGVDIERSPSPRALADVLEAICTPREVADVRQLSAAARESALLALWTRKEALLKAFGTGLGVDPTTLCGTVNRPVLAPLTSGFPACRVHPLDTPQAVVGALAVPMGTANGRLFVLGGVERA